MDPRENVIEGGNHGLITGGSAGLGFAIAREAVAQGMRVTLVARDPARLETAADRIRQEIDDAEVRVSPADLAVAGEAARVAGEANHADPLTFVCHAAGVSARGRLVDTPRAEFERLMTLNFFAAAELASSIGGEVAEQSGRFVLIGSLASRVAPPYLGAYPTSKHPLAALAQQMRMELGPLGLRTLLVCPGPIARDDGGSRYDDQAADLPEAARQPGGGAKVKALDPAKLAERILAASRAGRAELVTPLKARLLFTLSQLSPALGDWLLRRSLRGSEDA